MTIRFARVVVLHVEPGTHEEPGPHSDVYVLETPPANPSIHQSRGHRQLEELCCELTR